MIDAYIIGDDPLEAEKIRQVLLKERLNCPTSNVFGLSAATERLVLVSSAAFDDHHRFGLPTATQINTSKFPVWVFVSLPSDQSRTLELLEAIQQWPGRSTYNVLGVGSITVPRVVFRALRGALDDYLDIADLDSELAQCLAKWKSKSASRVEKGRTLAVIGPSGGSGTSTIAVNLATLFARQSSSVLLLDLQLNTGDLSALLDLKPEYTIADLCKNLDRLDYELIKRVVTTHSSGLCLLAAPRTTEELNQVKTPTVRQILTLIKPHYQNIVVDLQASYQDDQAELLRNCDTVILVMRLDFVSLRNTRRMIDHLERLGLPRESIQLVVNRLGQPKELPLSKVEEAFNRKITHQLPDDPRAVNGANNNGVPVVIEAPNSKVSKGLERLAQSLSTLSSRGSNSSVPTVAQSSFSSGLGRLAQKLYPGSRGAKP